MTVYTASNIGTGISPWAPVIDSVDVNDRGVMTVVWHESPTARQHQYLIEDAYSNHQTNVTVGEPAVIDISTWLSGGVMAINVILRPVAYLVGDGTNDPNTQNSGFLLGIPQQPFVPPYVGQVVATPGTADVGVPISFQVTSTAGGGGGGVS